MAANIERIVDFTVTKDSASVSQQGFGTLLGVHQVDVGVQAARFATYSSLAEMTAAGFTATDRAYLWAQVVFSQSPRPPTVAIGRRIPGVAETENVQITADAAGDWVFDFSDGDSTKSYTVTSAGGDEVALAEAARAAIGADATAFVTVPAGPIAVDNFDWTAAIAGTDITLTITPAGGGTFVQTPGTANTPAEDITVCLNAIEAEVEPLDDKDFYLFTIDTRSDADLTAAAAWAGARSMTKFFCGQTNDPDMLTGTTPNIGTVLGDLSYANVWLGWKAGDAEFFDAGMAAYAAAADLDAENGQITWALQELRGVSVSALSGSEIDNIAASNGEVYIRIAGRGVTQKGKAVSGEFADVQTTIAWTNARTQEAVFAVLATEPRKVPYTNAGIARVSSAMLGVLKAGVKNGHFSSDDPDLPRVTAPTSRSVSTADKNNRILRNVIGNALLAGAIHTVLGDITLEV